MAAMHVFSFALTNLVQFSLAGVASPGIDAKLAETMRALDTNGNGKVDMSELTGFAKSQGLSTQEVLTDFKELDVNNDGALDSSEIGPLFGVGANVAEDAVATASAVGAAPQSVAAVAELGEKALKEEALDAATDAALADPSPAKKIAPSAKNSMGLDLAVLEHDAQEQAGGVIANSLAERAQVLLARSAADEHKAEAFDVAVRALRGNATALSSQANHETREVARAASAVVSQKSMAKLKKLQEEEHKAEAAAHDRREQAKQAMQRVRKAQASLRTSA